MATTYTTNYNLGKQENHADKFDMDVITDNADKIDEALTAKADKSTTYTKTEVDTALSGKQATLTTEQLAAVNSGITSTDVEQIETNKNNILYNQAMGVKNLVKVDAQTYSTGNVDLSIDSNGICTISLSSGTTANTQMARTIADLSTIRANIDYTTILSGCPSDGNYSNKYALYISNSGSTAEKDEGNGVTVQPNQAVGTSSLAIIVRNGTTITSPLVFKPMLRPASISDSTFQPYAPSNRELYEMILALQ